MVGEADNKVTAEFHFPAMIRLHLLPSVYNLLRSTARSSTAADHALDAVFSHKVKSALAGTDDRLPALDRSLERTRH